MRIRHRHGAVGCAITWACWKTYVGRPERDFIRCSAMQLLACGLREGHRNAEAIVVLGALVDLSQRLGFTERSILMIKSDIAHCYANAGRMDEAITMRREVYANRALLVGGSEERHLAAVNLVCSLLKANLLKEARAVLRESLPLARGQLGENSRHTLMLLEASAMCVAYDENSTRADLLEAESTLVDVIDRTRRVFGPRHLFMPTREKHLEQLRGRLRTLDE